MDVFYCIGNFNEIPYAIKSPPGRIALRRKGNMSQKRPAAGGESCKAGFFLAYYLQFNAIRIYIYMIESFKSQKDMKRQRYQEQCNRVEFCMVYTKEDK